MAKCSRDMYAASRLYSPNLPIGRGRVLAGAVIIALVASLVIASHVNPSSPVVSALIGHAPILIVDNSEFDIAHGVVSGDGTPGNPYVISGWDILTVASTGIEIRGTNAHFVIENCSVHGGRVNVGILFNSTSNGVVRDVASNFNIRGLVASSAANVQVVDCDMSSNAESAFDLTDPQSFSIINCTITNNQPGYDSAVLIHGTGTSIRIENNTIATNTWDGIQAGWLVDSLIANNTIEHCEDRGIQISIKNTSLVDNEISGCHSWGMDVSGSSGDGKNLIGRNSVFNNGFGGIRAYSDEMPTTIEWNTVSGNSIEAGISLIGSDATIANNTLANNMDCGLLIDVWSTNNTIIDNTFVGDGVLLDPQVGYGNRFTSNTVNGLPLVYLDDVHTQTVGSAGQVIALNSTDITIRDMDLSRSSVGVQLVNSSGCLIENVTVVGNTYGVYLVDSSDRNQISNCSISDCGKAVYAFISSCNNSVSQCNITDSNTGIFMTAGSNDNALSGNKVSRCGDAILIDDRTTVDGNSIEDCYEGIKLLRVRECIVTNNTVVNSTLENLWLTSNSRYNLVANNTMQGGCYGIQMTVFLNTGAPNNNLIRGNLIENSSIEGIAIFDAYQNTISENIIRNCTLGIHLEGSAPGGHNFIYLNRFVNNGVNALNEGSGYENYWNTSEPVVYEFGGFTYVGYLGNYWDDYAGVDSDGNGIGDTPYQLGDEYDNYPLVEGVSYVPEFEGAWLVAVALMGTILVAVGIRRRKSAV